MTVVEALGTLVVMPSRLLLADDSRSIQRVVELTFADEDIDVVAVDNGAQAIKEIKSRVPDIVLADTRMPDTDGYDVASFVKNNPKLAHIPVVLLTGAFEPLDSSRNEGNLTDGVLVKPFDPQEVIGTVYDLLGITVASGLGHESRDRPVEFGTVKTERIVETATDDDGQADDASESALARAFERFLAAEQGLTPNPRIRYQLARIEESTKQISEDVLDEIVERVVARMTDAVVRETTNTIVSDVAERLVRDAIDRNAKTDIV